MVNQRKAFTAPSFDAVWHTFKEWLRHHPGLELSGPLIPYQVNSGWTIIEAVYRVGAAIPGI